MIASDRAGYASSCRPLWRAPTYAWITGTILLVSLAVACDGAGADPEATVLPRSAVVEADEAGYLSLFNAVSLAAAESTRFLNQLAVFATRGDAARAEIETDVRLLIDSFNLQLGQLEAAEPVPDRVEEAHVSMKTAIVRYRSAAELLLPLVAGRPALFEFSQFQEVMLDGGMHFHGAGELLP